MDTLTGIPCWMAATSASDREQSMYTPLVSVMVMTFVLAAAMAPTSALR